MSKKLFVFALGPMLFALTLTAEAQQPTNIPRLGYLTAPAFSALTAEHEAFHQGLRELGYVEGKNIFIERRSAEAKLDRLPDLAAELARLKPDVIVTAGPAPTRAAKGATSTIPIVMAFDNDPIGNGFIASLARPGGNITGLSTYAPELSGKRLEILNETVPKLSRVAVFGTSTFPGNGANLKEVERTAAAFKMKLQYLDVLIPKDIGAAFQAATKERAEAILFLGSVVYTDKRTELAELAVKYRLPASYSRSDHVEDGGLMSYGANPADLYRRAAIYVDKILKGRTPADLPVEQPKKFDFIINLKAARQIGLTIPPSVLARADRVLK